MENKTTRLYEGMFVLPQTYVREDQNRAFELLRAAFEKHDAQVKHMDIWSERSLAYEINHVREATFILTYFEAQADAVAKIERTFRITDNILRSLIVKPEADFNLEDFIKNRDTVEEETDLEIEKEEVKA